MESGVSPIDISANFAGLRFSNPLQAASGVLGASSGLMIRAFKAGAGCVVTKSIGLRPRLGYPGPNVVVRECYVINAMGLPNPGVQESIVEIREAIEAGVKIIGSVYGFSEEEYAQAAKRLSEERVEAIELNLSCPTVEGTGMEMGQNPELVKRVVSAVKSVIRTPLIAKLTPNVTDIVKIGKAAVDAGADAVAAINTVKGMAIDSEAMTPLLTPGFGGVSGPAIKPIALRCVYELYEHLDVPIIGCGGVVTGCDLVEFLLAGATAVQIGTGIMYGDLKIFNSLNQSLRRYLARKGLNSCSSLIGKAHKARSHLPP